MNAEKICSLMEEAAAEAGRFVIRESESFDIRKTETKGLNDFVSYVDKESEKMLVKKLKSIIPGAGFLAEEGTVSLNGERYTFIIDPLDGTTNFLHGLHPYAISLGLKEYDEIIAGVVYEASGNELFSAWRGGGSRLNGNKIHVSGIPDLAGSLVATGFPYDDFTRLDKYMSFLKRLLKSTHGVRRLGSAAIDLAYVACGRFEVFYEYSLNPWDIAAGMLLVTEAGGTVTDFSGNPEGVTGEEIVATNGLVHPEMLSLIADFKLNTKD
ncbi:MAG: inositol monophosphatase [Bacteroidales bacterium]|nr:inositol monophosphatase [Bacteroidales bacterium]